jgi:hypothetical protein
MEESSQLAAGFFNWVKKYYPRTSRASMSRRKEGNKNIPVSQGARPGISLKSLVNSGCM